MRKLIFILPLALLFACGEDEPEVEVVNLDTFEDRLSYALGAMNAKAFMESPDPNLDRLDKELVIKGFLANFSGDDISDCEKTLTGLYGLYGTDFDTTYLKEGSECRGRELSYYFYESMKDFNKLGVIKKDKLAKGFEHGLYEKDTLIDAQAQETLVMEFFAGIMDEVSQKMFAKARKKSNVREIEGGILIETIQEGKGGSPLETDDVRADYILTNAMGDTIQNSLAFREDPNAVAEAPAFNLQEVFLGWTKSFPHLKKGGKYRIYLPWEMVNDQRLQNQSVCFYIEFHDFGKAYTLAQKPQMPQ